MTDLSPEEQRRISGIVQKLYSNWKVRNVSRSEMESILTEQALSHAREKEVSDNAIQKLQAQLGDSIQQNARLREEHRETMNESIARGMTVISQEETIDELKRRAEELESRLHSSQIDVSFVAARNGELEAALKVIRDEIEPMSKQVIDPPDNVFARIVKLISRLTGVPKEG